MIDLLLNESTEPLPPQEIIQWVKENLTSKFSPEERSSYSDIGYFLLILIIEKVIAKPYKENIIEKVFQPLGMVQTEMLPFSEQAVNSNDSVPPC